MVIKYRVVNKTALLQLFAWASIMLLYFLYLQVRWPDSSAVLLLIHTLIAFSFFALIIYGYFYFIYSRYYKNSLSLKFILVCALFLLLSIATRIVAESEILAAFRFEDHIFNYGKIQLLYDTVTSFVAFAIAVLFVYVNETLKSQRREQEVINKQLKTELKLLKAQVQPHFLFNCLNSIYADAYEKAPDVAVSIERLSGLMRYFAHDNYQDKVPLEREIQFLKDYIALELDRSHLKHSLEFEVSCQKEDILVPPMLFIPLVENVFKHSFYSSPRPKSAWIHLTAAPDALSFKVTSQINEPGKAGPMGSGLRNLKERLQIIYPDSHRFIAEARGGFFIAELTLPL